MKQKDKQQTDAYLNMLKDTNEVSKTIKQPTMKKEVVGENRSNETFTIISISMQHDELAQIRQLAAANGLSVSKLLVTKALTLNEPTDV
jgi:hypothetical protein